MKQVTHGLYWFRFASEVQCSVDRCIALGNMLQCMQVWEWEDGENSSRMLLALLTCLCSVTPFYSPRVGLIQSVGWSEAKRDLLSTGAPLTSPPDTRISVRLVWRVTLNTMTLRLPVAKLGWSHGAESRDIKGRVRWHLVPLIETPHHSCVVASAKTLFGGDVPYRGWHEAIVPASLPR